MENINEPDPRTPGQPVDNDTDVNQTDHISAQLEEEDNDLKSGDELEEDVVEDDEDEDDDDDLTDNDEILDEEDEDSLNGSGE